MQLPSTIGRFVKFLLTFLLYGKSNKIEQFLDCKHAGNVVVSWSINAPQVIDREEHGTARFHERLLAARRCVDRGFKVAFHMDPLIWHQDWKQGYSFVCDQIQKNFKPSEVHIISLGALRFQPEQRHMMRERFGMSSLVTSAEMHTSEGGKLRYDSSLRREMFDFVIAKMKSLDPQWKIFLCMETPESWISSFEKTPMQIQELKEIFRPLPKIRSEEIFTN